MKVGIAIPLYNDPNVVRAVEEVITQASRIPSGDFKIVIADSSPVPEDYSKYRVFKDKRIKVVRFPGTIGQARDHAVENLPDRDVILNLDSDCIPMKNWVSSYLKLLEEYDLAYGVYHTKGHILSNFLISLGTAPLGGNMAYKRKVWEKVDGFKLPRYEDTLFLKKARKAGFTSKFDSTISVDHLRPHGLWRTIKDDLAIGLWMWITSKF
ncbi:MAG: glycosyltransferase [Candidatus Micrarchaeia archaeon]